mmetsp:Transcript_18748/g.28525  ORF Transcript_18748/g.28525 Transcript_18748/m.28525 type:complete len:197 (+) Transcript_18748:251-841(+)
MSQEANAAAIRGGGKFVALGIFLFACLGLALLYPYNAIISASDWFGYVMPNEANIAGRLSNANFVASLITTFVVLAAASPKEIKETTPTENPKAPPIRRQSSLYETFTKGAKSTVLDLHARIYIGLLLEAVPLLVFAIIYPTIGVAKLRYPLLLVSGTHWRRVVFFLLLEASTLAALLLHLLEAPSLVWLLDFCAS